MASYEAFPYTTPQQCTAVSQLSFISNHAILHYEANNNQAIACIAQQLWHAQEPSFSAKLSGKCRAWTLGINPQIVIKDLVM